MGHLSHIFRGSQVQGQGLYKATSDRINVTSDNQGNYYLDQKKSIEGVVKAAKVSGCKVQKLPYPLEELSLSKANNAKDEAEAKEVAKVPYRALIGMRRHHGAHHPGYSVRLERTVGLL